MAGKEEVSESTRISAPDDLNRQIELFRIMSESLQRDSSRIDSFFANVKWMVGLISSLLFVLVAAISFLGYSNFRDLKLEILAGIPVQVQQELREGGRLTESAETLVKGLESIEAEYEKFKEWSATLRIVEESGDQALADGHFAYERINEIQGKSTISEQDRREALLLLNALIELGQRGGVDPNTLFNSAVVADRLHFVVEAGKLSLLAYAWKPSTSHRAKLLQSQDLLGVSYQFDRINSRLIELKISSIESRAAAWQEILALISSNPRIEGEQAYSRAQNIAVRNRTEGYYDDLIESIEAAAHRDPVSISSYAFATLAELYAWRGDVGWELDYWHSVERSVQKLKEESPRSSWYSHTVRDLSKEANRLGVESRLAQVFTNFDIDIERLRASLE